MSLLFSIPLCLLLVVPLWGQTPEELLRAGDRSARAGRYAEALSAWRQAYERTFPRFRGLRFLLPIRAEFLDRRSLRARIIQVLEKELEARRSGLLEPAALHRGGPPPGEVRAGPAHRAVLPRPPARAG